MNNRLLISKPFKYERAVDNVIFHANQTSEVINCRTPTELSRNLSWAKPVGKYRIIARPLPSTQSMCNSTVDARIWVMYMQHTCISIHVLISYAWQKALENKCFHFSDKIKPYSTADFKNYLFSKACKQLVWRNQSLQQCNSRGKLPSNFSHSHLHSKSCALRLQVK